MLALTACAALTHTFVNYSEPELVSHPLDLCTEQSGLQCYGSDIRDAGSSDSAAACCALCQAEPACAAWTWNAGIDQHCWIKTGCSDQRYDSGYVSGTAAPAGWVRCQTRATSSLSDRCTVSMLTQTPVLPTQINQYDGNNPLHITHDPVRSNNFFLILGDWGKYGGPGECQRTVSAKMNKYVADQRAAGKTLLFVAVVGDNFYWTGQPGGSWDQQWADVYGTADPSSPLHDVPFLAVMGNHDYGDSDPYAACPWAQPFATVGNQSYASHQMNSDKNPARPSSSASFYLPDYSYHYSIPELALELIAVDQNAVDIGGLGGDASGHQKTFELCGGEGNVVARMRRALRSKAPAPAPAWARHSPVLAAPPALAGAGGAAAAAAASACQPMPGASAATAARSAAAAAHAHSICACLAQISAR